MKHCRIVHMMQVMLPCQNQCLRTAFADLLQSFSIAIGFMPSQEEENREQGQGQNEDLDKGYCMPPQSFCNGREEIAIPKGQKRTELARLGLVGKISLHSSMTTEEVLSEVRSVFKEAMGGRAAFPVKFLQSVGGGCKTLFDPQTSSSFEWTAKEVAQSAGRGAIYILAEDELVLPDQATTDPKSELVDRVGQGSTSVGVTPGDSIALDEGTKRWR